LGVERAQLGQNSVHEDGQGVCRVDDDGGFVGLGGSSVASWLGSSEAGM